MARLSDETVREMRRVFGEWQAAEYPKGYRELGDAFGCSMWTARDIVTFRTRKSA
jgi:hypothetical protein